MPAKLTHTQEASFLLDIIKHSDLKSINWQAIADKKKIKKGAAQMRYQRLKQAIEKAEAAEAGITLPEGPRSDGEEPSHQFPVSHSAPVTPKKPRANKVEKPKTPSTGRKKKVAIDTSMISPHISMISTTSMSASPMQQSISPMQQSMSPAPAPIIKMEAQEYMPIHQTTPVATPMPHQNMAGMPY
ncbi:hypothetical protein H072_5052 [Dactylellina haptotyla CBS 200.50]|uniref:Myb-like DNA-binding domain-containing protein n=1 Tax=Dactylellina haptotyla (strain CBS 200.50) TaxID=1284197 RepID=S8ADH0_DACHA|nr:hypothetical protein H072_5052 [Dactylellina haptotyla CBS 200.50]